METFLLISLVIYILQLIIIAMIVSIQQELSHSTEYIISDRKQLKLHLIPFYWMYSLMLSYIKDLKSGIQKLD